MPWPNYQWKGAAKVIVHRSTAISEPPSAVGPAQSTGLNGDMDDCDPRCDPLR
jgi:hypothetical protein